MSKDNSVSTILIVDDTDDTRDVLRTMLEMKGCRVLEAADGAEGVEVAAREVPDLILMDLNLPELDGFDATRRIRERAEAHAIPVVAMSAYYDGDWRQQALAAGCVACVRKPLDPEVFDSVISSLLPKSDHER